MTETPIVKIRRAAGPVILCSEEDGHLVPVSGVAPFASGSADQLLAWLKKNAIVGGKYVFVKRICGATITKKQVEETDMRVE